MGQAWEMGASNCVADGNSSRLSIQPSDNDRRRGVNYVNKVLEQKYEFISLYPPEIVKIEFLGSGNWQNRILRPKFSMSEYFVDSFLNFAYTVVSLSVCLRYARITWF